MNMKRLLALLLSAILLPLGFLRLPDGTRADAEPDIWVQIEQYETERLSEQSIASVNAAETDYAAMADGVAAIVENWSGYVPGSLLRSGDFLIWDGVDGTGYGWSPRFRKILHSESFSDANPADGEGVETESYAVRGGSPSSTDVTLFGPYYGLDSSFTDQYKNEARSIVQATGGTYTCYQKYDVNINVIAEALETSGVVIFDSHGSTDYASGNDYTSRANTSYLCINSGEGVTAEDMATVQGPYGSYKHALNAGGGSYFIDGTAIANHMTGDAPNSLLWMAICLGMATDGMYASIRDKGVEVVYGYSQSVTFSGDYAWEKQFWNKMKDGSDVSEAIAYMKERVGIKDPYTSVYPAYPIVVSSEDEYPGHGNVDKAQEVYSSWTLFPQFTVTAVSSDETLGTVETSGTTVIAEPKTGCAVTGYEVLSGTATVRQNGDGLSRTLFSVRAESDCTIRINFARRSAVRATFVTPDGVSCAAISGYTGDTITLPTPSGTPTANAQSYAFYGWVEARVPDTDVRPDCLYPGDSVMLTENRTFYALYYYATQDGAPVPAETYQKLYAAPSDWAGKAVLTYDGSVVLSANVSASSVSTSSAAVGIGSTGIRVVGDTLTDVPDTYLYEIESVGNGKYTIRMMSGERYYLCYTASSNKLAATKTVIVSGGKSAAYWTFGWESGKPVVTNDQTATATLCYDAERACFNCKKNNTGEALTIFTVPDSSLKYTTELQYASEPSPTATAAPTATPSPTPTPTATPTAAPTATPAPLYGDANCDGSVTAADAALVLRALVGLDTLSEQGMKNALVSGGETLSASDAAAILRYVVKLIDALPVA